MQAFKAKIERAWKRTPAWLFALLLMLIVIGLVYVPEYLLRPKTIPAKIVYDLERDSFEIITKRNPWWSIKTLPINIEFNGATNTRYGKITTCELPVNPEHFQIESFKQSITSNSTSYRFAKATWIAPTMIRYLEGEWIVERGHPHQVYLEVTNDEPDKLIHTGPIRVKMALSANDQWGERKSYAWYAGSYLSSQLLNYGSGLEPIPVHRSKALGFTGMLNHYRSSLYAKLRFLY